MNRILLHICCGVCASQAVLRLREENFDVAGFFYNPNIHPQEEYFRREETARQVSSILKFDLLRGPYDKDNWFAKTKGLENKAEGGRRCNLCFKIRLEETYKMARQMNIFKFSTTLTISPHKDSGLINEIGKEIDREAFIFRDFKKEAGFQLAIEFAKRYNLYRQDYCGCIYSRRERKIS